MLYLFILHFTDKKSRVGCLKHGRSGLSGTQLFFTPKDESSVDTYSTHGTFIMSLFPKEITPLKLDYNSLR